MEIAKYHIWCSPAEYNALDMAARFAGLHDRYCYASPYPFGSKDEMVLRPLKIGGKDEWRQLRELAKQIGFATMSQNEEGT